MAIVHRLHAIRRIRYCTALKVHARASGKKIELTILQISRLCRIFIRFICHLTCHLTCSKTTRSLYLKISSVISTMHSDNDGTCQKGAFLSRCQCEVLVSKYPWQWKIAYVSSTPHWGRLSKAPNWWGKWPLVRKLQDLVSTGGG